MRSTIDRQTRNGACTWTRAMSLCVCATIALTLSPSTSEADPYASKRASHLLDTSVFADAGGFQDFTFGIKVSPFSFTLDDMKIIPLQVGFRFDPAESDVNGVTVKSTTLELSVLELRAANYWTIEPLIFRDYSAESPDLDIPEEFRTVGSCAGFHSAQYWWPVLKVCHEWVLVQRDGSNTVQKYSNMYNSIGNGAASVRLEFPFPNFLD